MFVTRFLKGIKRTKKRSVSARKQRFATLQLEQLECIAVPAITITVTPVQDGATTSDFTATINWGDNTTTAGAIGAGTSNFTVSGTHTYAEAGTFTITVVISDVGGSTATDSDSATISDAALSATATSVSATEG